MASYNAVNQMFSFKLFENQALKSNITIQHAFKCTYFFSDLYNLYSTSDPNMYIFKAICER